MFDDASQARQAADELVRRGKRSLDLLLQVAVNGKTIERQGWAISCLGKIGGRQVDEQLAKIQHNTSESKLVRTWAAAARIELATTF